MTEGQKLVEELGQALANDDNTAASIAAVNIVGEVLDKLDRIAVALEALAGCVDRFDNTHFQTKSS